MKLSLKNAIVIFGLILFAFCAYKLIQIANENDQKRELQRAEQIKNEKDCRHLVDLRLYIEKESRVMWLITNDIVDYCYDNDGNRSNVPEFEITCRDLEVRHAGMMLHLKTITEDYNDELEYKHNERCHVSKRPFLMPEENSNFSIEKALELVMARRLKNSP